MNNITELTKLSMNLSIVNTMISKKIDIKLSAHGISFTEFTILYFLETSLNRMMRRIDLAEKSGLSASGVTRLVLPMEKIGLVKREINKRDARVSLVKITESGKRVLNEAAVTLNEACEDLFSSLTGKKTGIFMQILLGLGGFER